MQKKFVGDKCGRGREGQHGYKQQQTRSSVGGKAKNSTRTHSIHQHNTGACMRGRWGKEKTNKYLTESIHQQSSMRGWAKKQPKENTKSTPSPAMEHEGRKTNTTHRPTPTTVEQSGKRETTKTHLHPRPHKTPQWTQLKKRKEECSPI